ncbi:hypothetical protein EDD85DRAFT_848113 [Armillaria nabsnona]|nr:hypothetical protein EDD85DRAFT_848113 [Armillaria nabsnona]
MATLLFVFALPKFMNPEACKRARAEIHILPLVSWLLFVEEMESLLYLDAVIHEVHRHASCTGYFIHDFSYN